MSQAKQLADNVEAYLKQNLDPYPTGSFHFASRLWLFTGDKWARNYLDEHAKKLYAGSAEQQRSILKKKLANPKLVNATKPYRRAIFKKYPKLAAYNVALFNTLMAETLYGKDLKPLIREFISDEELIDTFRRLQTDARSLRLLSTHATNFLWLTKYYLADSENEQRLKLNPVKLLKLLPGYARLVEQDVISPSESLKLQINLLTHAVIAESLFYVREVHDEAYKKLCAGIEKLIENNYFEISLDNKFEFLICAKICGYKTRLSGVIEQEALNSLNPKGKYLVDVLNRQSQETGKDLKRSEHRNTLFIMSQKPWRFVTINSNSNRTKLTIGSFEKISFPDFGLMDVIAKIDTGATSGSIHATNVKEIKLKTGKRALRFQPFDREPGVTVYRFSQKLVRSSNGQSSLRYIIPTTVVIQGVQYPINISLADRSLMKKDVLVGRKFLRSHGFMVDVKKGTKYRWLGRQT